MNGIEPSSSAWKAVALPLSYTREWQDQAHNALGSFCQNELNSRTIYPTTLGVVRPYHGINPRKTPRRRRHLRPPFPSKIDKSVLALAEPKRRRDKSHRRFVTSQPCLICGRHPSDPHHLCFAQPRALGVKVSDEFTVLLCRDHHRQLHEAGNEVAWWEALKTDALRTARQTKDRPTSPVKAQPKSNDDRKSRSLPTQ